MSRPKAEPKVVVDNNSAAVTRRSFAEGEETAWHRHGHDDAVVPLTRGTLVPKELGASPRETPLVAGQPYFRPEGVEHSVVNGTDGPFTFLEIKR